MSPRLSPPRRSARAVMALGFVAAAAMPGGAMAASWSLASSPQVGRAQHFGLAAAFGPSGRGMLTWDRTSLSYLRSKEVGVVDGAGVLTKHFTVRRPSLSVAESADAAGRVWIAWADAARQRAGVAQLLPTGRVSATQWLPAPAVRMARVGIAAASDGSAVVAWTSPAGDRSRVTIAVRRPGKRFGSPRSLGTTEAGYVGESIGGGHWLVAAVTDAPANSNKNGQVLAWSGTLRIPTSRRQVIGPAPTASELSIAVDGRGRSWLMWRSQAPDEEEASAFNLRVASISPNGRPRGPQIIASGLGWGSGVPRLAASPTGGATVLTGIDHGPHHPSEMRIITADATGTWRPPSQPLMNPGLTEGVTYRADGAALVTWDSYGDSDRNPPSAYATLVDPAGQVGSAELIGGADALVGWFAADGRPLAAAIPRESVPSTIDVHVRTAQ